MDLANHFLGVDVESSTAGGAMDIKHGSDEFQDSGGERRTFEKKFRGTVILLFFVVRVTQKWGG